VHPDVQELLERYRREVPLWGGLPAAMRLKRALVRRIGIAEAHTVAREHLGVPGVDSLHARTPAGLRDAAMRSPAFTLLREGGKRFRQPPPRVIGEHTHSEMWGRSRAAWLARLDDVTIRGRSSLIRMGENILIDREPHEGTLFEDNPEYDPGVMHAEHDRLWMMEPQGPALEIEEAFMLTGSHTIDFGHWLTEALPRLGMAMLAGWRGGMPVLVDEVIPSTIRDALPALLPPSTPLVTVPHLATARIERLWTVPNPIFIGFYPTQFTFDTWDQMATEPHGFCEALDAACAGVAPARTAGPEHVYLARRPGRKKALRNHAAIEDVVRARGFSVVYPEDLTFAEQVALMRGAKFVVAPEGSNNLLTLLAGRGTKVCTLNPPYTHPLLDVNGLLAHRGVEMTVITGAAHPTDEFCPFWWDYDIDSTALDAFLAESTAS
jgi:hypothetical protein